ncbi:MAG: CRTAC1 family protein [bacterium]|nr:CRTAC1 family protein [bacterium]
MAAALLIGVCVACGEGPERTAGPTPDEPAAEASATAAPERTAERRGDEIGEIFVERAAELGIDFYHFNGMTGEYHMAEITGTGGALFDYDNDGDLDAYLVQGSMLRPELKIEEAVFPPRHPVPLTDRLYRNDLEPGNPESLRFTDVTEAAGLGAFGYGMAVATGDYDNDGWIDLYVTNLGSNQLLHNNGLGADGRVTFSDVTAAAGVDDDRWSVPAAFIDYDRDGRLDLFVGNYLIYPATVPICKAATGAPDYCGPGNFTPLEDRLFHNRGDGTFEDVTEAAGLREGFGPALGVVVADFTGDGWLDLYVANDATPNNFWINDGDGTFTDEALLAGCSLNASGQAESSMGVDGADFDGDGDIDLFMGHLLSQTNTLYRNDGTGMFDDSTLETGLGAPSRPNTTFGTAWLDYDNDGWLDLFTANGAVMKIEELARKQDPYPFHERNQLYRNLGGSRFAETTAQGGKVFELSEVSRGAAFGDVDNDGDTDILMINNNGPVRLLINQLGNRRSWLGLHLVGGEPVRDVLGARAELRRRAQPSLWRWVRVDGSFCSVSDPRLLFGLGDDPQPTSVRVWWPDGRVEEWTDLVVGRYTRLHQGRGRKVES